MMRPVMKFRFLVLASAIGAVLVAAGTAAAQVPAGDTALAEMAASLRPGDEAVRRIVERAMAAVELAEAKANQEVAVAQVRIANLEAALAAYEVDLAAARASEAELVVALEASIAEADRFAVSDRAARGDRDSLVAEIEAWKDSAARASAQVRRITSDRDELTARLEALHGQHALVQQALEDARSRLEAVAVSGGDWADTLAALRSENASLQSGLDNARDRIQAYQHRSGVVEESLRLEAARSASLESAVVALRASLAAQRRALEDEQAAAAASRSALSETVTSLRTQNVELRRSLDEERDRHAALATRYAQLVETEVLLRTGALTTETVARVLAERDALRVEVQGAARVLDDAAAAIRSARTERDEARRLAAGASTSAAPGTVGALLAEKDREIAALRQALLAVAAGTPSTPSVATPAPSVPVTTPSEPASAPTAVVTPVPEPTAPPAMLPAVVFDPAGGSYEELAAIPLVGPTRARAIVWYRENVGPIRDENDLKSVPGFNDDRIRSLRSIWRSKEN